MTAIKDIVGIFVPEWRIMDPGTLVVKKNAGVNQNYTIERPKTEGDADPGHGKVFLKFHGEVDRIIEVFKHLVPNKHEEAKLCHDYGQSGLGAKVYGFFQTKDGTLGRVDEFLDARNLEPEDVEDAAVTWDIHNMLCYVEQEDNKDLLNSLDLLAFNKLFEDFVNQYNRLGLDIDE
ncbi:hypothetical protein Asppvi_006891 [Aspergillus pseudoviridinutans]|uniref:Uncharacterized protein n=1 Tax=Aspergillus pseudoviridinutans TaxID=1517512 RepID=A0A9P3BER6_9EURO|nr:uncharacterized protein Asppvi_006891 [Aspergillus pseudoviridinutans]GIJ87975.1 hypothetical protein Asppvi_006891 [Aspergillus pseudoviridinutans]